MPPPGPKTIFVANIPFDVSEEELANVFSEAGPVSNVEIKFDTNTGRSKGYAFVQFYDEATAASAVRNLASVEVHGRNLRVELSSDNQGDRQRGDRNDRGRQGGGRQSGARDDGPPGGYGGPGGYGPPGNAYGGPQMGGPGPGPGMGGGGGAPPVDLGMLPQGKDAHGGKATDAISATLAAVSPGQMQDVMAGMKTLIETQPDQARQLLQSKPQLAYALFQAMLLLNIVDASVLQRIQPVPSNPNPYPAQGGYNAPPMAQPSYGGGPPQPPTQGYRPPGPPQMQNGPGPGGYGGPSPMQQVPPPASGFDALPPHAQAALAGLPDEQKAMVVQVLSLTPDQIQGLDATQRQSVVQLRQQFLGA